MKKEWIMSDEARLEKKKRVQDNRERRMAEAKVREGSRRQQDKAESGETNGESANLTENPEPMEQDDVPAPAPQEARSHVPAPAVAPAAALFPAPVPLPPAPLPPAVPLAIIPQQPSQLQPSQFFPPPVPVQAAPVTSPVHIPSPVAPVSTLLPASIIPAVTAPNQASSFQATLPVPSQIINEAVPPSVAVVPDLNMNGNLSAPLTAPIGLTPLNSDTSVQSLLAQSVQSVPAAPPAATLVSPDLAAVQVQARVQLTEQLAQVAMAQQQQQLVAAVAAQQSHAVQQVVEAAAVIAQAQQQQVQQQAQLEAAQIVAQQQQLVAGGRGYGYRNAAMPPISPTSPQMAAAVAAAATAAGIVSTPAQTLFQSTNPGVVPPSIGAPSQSIVMNPSQSIVMNPSQSMVVQTHSSMQIQASRNKEVIAVPRDLLQKLVQNYSNSLQQRNVERHENSPPPPSEAPVKCECKCRCGRYPGETLIVDQVMIDLLDNSTKQPCDEGTSWIDRSSDEMTTFEKELMSCISDEARQAAESGVLSDDEEDLEMSEYDQDLLDEIEQAMKKTHKISQPDWVFTTGRNAQEAEIIQEAIKATTIFCQEINVFCRLSREDQRIIIKVGCLGFMILNAARSFNFLTIGAAATNEIHDISIKLFKMFHSEWKSSEAIINVMCMLLLFDPDVSGIENVEGLDDEYDQYSLLMEKVMYQQYGNDRTKSHAEFNEVQALLRSVASHLSTLNELLEKVGTDSAILAILDNRIG
ncbi:hypothetical protein L596_014874 [Steinernema carpocapsae]|nr:hypothetical protein L596_014874 [Steinernema carpocapsae]